MTLPRPYIEGTERRQPEAHTRVYQRAPHPLEELPDNPDTFGQPGGADLWASPSWHEHSVNRDKGRFAPQRQLPPARDRHAHRWRDPSRGVDEAPETADWTSPLWSDNRLILTKAGAPNSDQMATAPSSGPPPGLRKRALDTARRLVTDATVAPTPNTPHVGGMSGDAEFKESEHKRAASGEFTSGGGGGSARSGGPSKRRPHDPGKPHRLNWFSEGKDLVAENPRTGAVMFRISPSSNPRAVRKFALHRFSTRADGTTQWKSKEAIRSRDGGLDYAEELARLSHFPIKGAADAEFKDEEHPRDPQGTGKFVESGGGGAAKPAAPAKTEEKKKVPHQKDQPGRGQAPKGGMIGLNQEHYRGGQFLPHSERTEKGAHKQDVRARGTGRVMIEGGRQPDGTWGKWETRPSPDHYSIYGTIGNYTDPESRDGKLRLIDLDKREIYFNNGERVTPQSKFGDEPDAPTLQDLVDLYNEGERWHGAGVPARKPKAETVAARQGAQQETKDLAERHRSEARKLAEAAGGKEWQTPDGSKHRVYFKGRYRDVWYDVDDGDFHSRNLSRSEVSEMAAELRQKAKLAADAWASPRWDSTKPPAPRRQAAQDSALRTIAYATARRLVSAKQAVPRMAFDHALVRGALRSQIVRIPLAMDKASVRTFSPDGHLHVALSNISRAQVSPYWGKEIPDADKLGLDPNRKYMLLRHPDELRKAAQTFNGLPVLAQHQPVAADDHPHELVVGSTGTDARYEHPFLMNSLHIWAKPAIDAIGNGQQRELSCAYHYIPVMKPGVYEGKPFDGIMTNIAGNHVALVEDGRVGPAATVADAMPFDLRYADWFKG